MIIDLDRCGCSLENWSGQVVRIHMLCTLIFSPPNYVMNQCSDGKSKKYITFLWYQYSDWCQY